MTSRQAGDLFVLQKRFSGLIEVSKEVSMEYCMVTPEAQSRFRAALARW
jgi:hypothetical protein